MRSSTVGYQVSTATEASAMACRPASAWSAEYSFIVRAALRSTVESGALRNV
ncbi:MAG: hypothetical protein MUE66_10295 [Acidimicrobiia bacterium]|nr:hypothetical protein [Acidimicrobiia bacterium]